MGINYTYTKQLDWDMSSDLASSNVSYSDYNQLLEDTNAIMQGEGNDLNNWPNQAFKFFARWRISNKTTLHMDAHALWDFQGAKDGLTSLRQAVQGEPQQAIVMEALTIVEQQGAYDLDFRFNATLSYSLQENLKLYAYVQNLFDRGDSKRYSFDSGNVKATPKRVRFTEEPATYGVKLEYRF